MRRLRAASSGTRASARSTSRPPARFRVSSPSSPLGISATCVPRPSSSRRGCGSRTRATRSSPATPSATSASRSRSSSRRAAPSPRTLPSSCCPTTSPWTRLSTRAPGARRLPAGSGARGTSTAPSRRRISSSRGASLSPGWSRRRWSRAGRSPAGRAERPAHACGRPRRARTGRATQLAQLLGRAGVDPRACVPGRRRRLRLQGHAAGRDAAGRGRRRACGSAGRSSGRRTASRTSSPRRRAAACGPRSSSRCDARRPRCSALRARLLADLGAYLLPSTAIPPHTTAMLLTRLRTTSRRSRSSLTGARTNKVPTAPYRGAGRPEADVPDRAHGRRGRARAGARPGRAAPPQPRARVPVPRRRSAGRTTRATTSAASTCAVELGGPSGAGGDGPGRRDRGRARASSARAALGDAPSTRGGDGRVVVRVGSIAARPGPRDDCSRRSPPTRLGVDAGRRGPPGDSDGRAGRRRLVRQPLDRDGRLRGGVGRVARSCARPAAGEAGRAPASSPTRSFTSGALRRGRRGRPATGTLAIASGSSRSTTPGGSSTRCSPTGRSSAATVQGLGRRSSRRSGTTRTASRSRLVARLPRC